MCEVRQAIMKLTSDPADFDEVMFTLVSGLTDKLHDNSVIEAIVEDIFVQVCLCVCLCVACCFISTTFIQVQFDES